MAIQCRQCGRANQEERDFCFSCGAFLEWSGERAEPRADPVTPVPPGRPTEAPRETVRRLSLQLSPLDISVQPGERRTILATVGNLGSTVEGAELHLTGLPDGWWTFEPRHVSLLPSTEARATLTIHPPRDPASQAGEYPIAVDVSAQLDRKAGAEAVVTVRPYVQLSTQVRPENSSARLGATHRVRVTNASNTRVAVRLEASDKDQTLTFRPQTTNLELEAGETATAAFQVRAPRIQWLQRQPARRFQLRVYAPDSEPADLPASFAQRPLLPRWMIPAAAVTAVALVAGLVILGHGGGTNLQVQHARAAAAAPTTIVRPPARPETAAIPTTVAPAIGQSRPSTTPPPAAPPPAAPGLSAPGHTPSPAAPVATSMSAPPATTAVSHKLHGVVRWPDKSAAVGVNIAIYPQGYRATATKLIGTNIGTATGGTYATSICTRTPCQNVQAFLKLPVNTVFPDGCTLPLTTSAGPVTGFPLPAQSREVDWTVVDGTCAADPSGKPIDDPNIPAYTTEYVEQKVNTLGGGTVDSTPTSTTTTSLP